MTRQILSIKRKALTLNLDSSIYGTIAEIGGGQEVARAFFQAGGASGTIAKTISAYDKTFSDYLYNNETPGRYVSEDRLQKMLNKEFGVLNNVLEDRNERFFVFANTIETLNYKKTNVGHGWLGVKFQLQPNTEPNEVIIHTELKENDGILQQYTLGYLGVNLIYACYNYANSPKEFLASLMDNLSADRTEINMISMKGPDLDYIDNRLLAVQLVKTGMSDVAIFNKTGEIKQPTDFLYKKNLMVIRGSFRPITKVGFDMIKSGYAQLKKDANSDLENTKILCEITLNNLTETHDFDEKDYLNRVDILNSMGQNVMISNFKEYYKLSSYFSTPGFKIKNTRFIIGADIMSKVFDESFYQDLPGGLLEAIGLLFKKNFKLYVYPGIKNQNLITSKEIEIKEKFKFLYKYLTENKHIIDLDHAKKDLLHISSKKVRNLICNSEVSWENMVTKNVAEYIKLNNLYKE